MAYKFILSINFHLLLNKIDQESANQAQQQGCPYCGHALHQANYPRSPFGLLAAFRDHYDKRLSFCCDTCRKRTTPQSVRFFGRRWFPAPLFMLISALMLGPNERRCAQVKRHFGMVVSEATWKRWRRWWRESFMATKFWQQAKGLVTSGLGTSRPLPRALLDLFQGAPAKKMRLLLQFLAPLTGGILRAV